MPTVDDFEECAAFLEIRSFKLRLADGLRDYTVQRVLRINKKSDVLCFCEVNYQLTNSDNHDILQILFTEDDRAPSLTIIAVNVTLPGPDLLHEFTTMMSFTRHLKIKFLR